MVDLNAPAPPLKEESPELLARIYKLFRDYFDKAEKKRRWSIKDDIPWKDCNKALPRAISDVVETFSAVELYLPDYLAKLIPQVRTNRGRSWMLANWGYEECKHSMALEDWLLHSGTRSDEQLADLEATVFTYEWNLPYDNARAMVCYTMVQELATAIHYENLRKMVISEGGCPALERTLQLVAMDERAHADFFRRLVHLYLDDDREATLEQIRRVFNTFTMPAVHMLADSMKRQQEVRELRIFDEQMFLYDVTDPILMKLGLTRKDLRRRASPREIVAMGVKS